MRVRAMANKVGHWSRWCRLCAKEDPEIDYELDKVNKLNGFADGVFLTVEQALERFFCVRANYGHIPAKRVCKKCYSRLLFNINFVQRVQRVQEMFNFLLDAPTDITCDLESVRLKFNITDDSLPPPTAPTLQCFVENINGETEVQIKQEENEREQLIDGHEYLSPRNFENEEDPFYCSDDVLSESSFKARTEIVQNTCSTVKNGDTKLARGTNKRRHRSYVEMPRIEQLNSSYIKKENTSKDFPLNVACGDCKEVFSLYSNYYKHLKMFHLNSIKEKWKCPSCDSTLQTRDSFKRHMRLHMPAECLSIKCPECDHRFLTKKELETHLKQRHCNEKLYICEECGIGVSTLSNLKKHIITHSDETPFACEICKKKFKSASQLKRHIDTHGPKKHVCTICGLELNSRITFKRHFLVHSDVMEHKCNYCGRGFKRSKTLKTHLLLHTGLKPYMCDFCDRTFANGSNCRSHMKKMHPIELTALEASGGKAPTQNLPKLENLKALSKKSDHLTHVSTKPGSSIDLDT